MLRRFVEPSDSRLWRVLGLLRRGVPQETIREATGISPWFLAEMGRNVGLEADVRAAGARLADPADADGASLLATAKRAGFADRDLAGAGRGGGGGPAGGQGRARPRARLRDGRHVRRRVRGRDAVLLLDLRVGRLAARGARRSPARPPS